MFFFTFEDLNFYKLQFTPQIGYFLQFWYFLGFSANITILTHLTPYNNCTGTSYHNLLLIS